MRWDVKRQGKRWAAAKGFRGRRRRAVDVLMITRADNDNHSVTHIHGRRCGLQHIHNTLTRARTGLVPGSPLPWTSPPGPLFLLRLGGGVADDHTRNTHTKADLNHSQLYCPFEHDLTYAQPPSCSPTGRIYHLDTHFHPFTPVRIRQSITASRWLNAQVHALSVNIAITSPPPC